MCVCWRVRVGVVGWCGRWTMTTSTFLHQRILTLRQFVQARTIDGCEVIIPMPRVARQNRSTCVILRWSDDTRWEVVALGDNGVRNERLIIVFVDVVCKEHEMARTKIMFGLSQITIFVTCQALCQRSLHVTALLVKTIDESPHSWPKSLLTVSHALSLLDC